MIDLNAVSDRMTLGRMHNPVRGILHGSAAIASVIGGIVLYQRASSDRALILAIYCMSMVCLYTVSSLYHSIPWEREWKDRMQRVDHSMIYILIAGTYSPVACAALDGWQRQVALLLVWGIAMVGVAQKVLWPRLPHAFSVALQTFQGWLALPLLIPLAHRFTVPALILLMTGGLLYTVGMICFVTKKPRLWPRVFSYHEAFHVCVVLGSILHYVMAFWYLAHA